MKPVLPSGATGGEVGQFMVRLSPRIRACGQSSDGDCRSGEVDHGAVAFVGLLAACCYSAKFFELAEEVFDRMSPLVHLEVAIDCLLSVSFRRNDGGGAPVVELGANALSPDFESPFSAGSLRVDPNDRAVDHGVFEIRVAG